ncbi:NAD(P)-binding protein [Xylaria venustula]|nr:NAD(P)-binding protein [Xylaria venustula]
MYHTVFITGANSGIGLATTKVFLENNWNVVATARNLDAATDLQKLATVNEARLLTLPLDLFSVETFQPALEAAIGKFGKVDVLINNAGYGQYGMMEALDIEDYRRQFEVNVFGPISLTKQFLTHCFTTRKTSSPSQVIYVSSGAAHFGLPLSSAYNGSKAALNLFAESVSYELGALDPPVTVKIVVIHGGVHSTNFLHSTNSALVLEELEATHVSPAHPRKIEMMGRYGAYAAHVLRAFGSIAEGRIPVEIPAEKIFTAATDGTRKLRYFIGGSGTDRPMTVRMEGLKREDDEETCDDRYMRWMRERFA